MSQSVTNKTLILGASGTVGSEIVKNLKQKGHEVVRATSKKDLEKDQVYLNLLNHDGLEQAMNGVHNLFLLSPPGHANQDQLLIPVIESAKKNKIKKIVLMTAMGANANENAPLRIVEKHLEKSGINYNIIRPNWFMQNFNTYWIHGINEFGKILLPTGDGKGSFIDARDIAAVAATLLVTDKFNNQDFDLTGETAFHHDQIADILSQSTGRKITYENISPAQMQEGLLQAGLPRPYVEFMLVILDFFKLGYSERTTNAVELITGKKPISFENYAKDYAQAWSKN